MANEGCILTHNESITVLPIAVWAPSSEIRLFKNGHMIVANESARKYFGSRRAVNHHGIVTTQTDGSRTT